MTYAKPMGDVRDAQLIGIKLRDETPDLLRQGRSIGIGVNRLRVRRVRQNPFHSFFIDPRCGFEKERNRRKPRWHWIEPSSADHSALSPAKRDARQAERWIEYPKPRSLWPDFPLATQAAYRPRF